MLWRTNHAQSYVVVEAACDALVDGVDSPTLAELAGATRETAAFEVPDLWPVVAQELGLTDYDPDSAPAQLLSACAYVRDLSKRGIKPRDLTRLIRKEFHYGNGRYLDTLLRLDNEYDANDADRPADVLDAEVEATVAAFLA